MLKAFKRSAKGARLPEEKPTADLQTRTDFPVPAEVCLPMSMHIGAPAVPCVEKGQQVCVGTLIGQAGGFVSANIHSSVSGTVKEIRDFTDNGRTGKLVVITTDGKQTPDPELKPPVVTDKDSFLKAVRASGLVGLGGAGFPTDVKFNPKNPDAVDTLLINASECEGYLTSDNREMIENTDDIVDGILAAMKYLNIPRCIIGVEDNKPEAIKVLSEKTAQYSNITVDPLKCGYGIGSELLLIERCCGREVPHGKLPADAGVIVSNVSSIGFLGRYLKTGMPLVERRVTIEGDAVANACNVFIPVGTPIEKIVEYAGIKEGVQLAKIVSGGPMMGAAQAAVSGYLKKQNNGLGLLSKERATLPEANPCIRCGRCVDYCPIGLEPVEVAAAYNAKDFDRLGALHADYCVNCGSCSYVCPATRPVTQTMNLAKGWYMTESKKRQGGNK